MFSSLFRTFASKNQQKAEKILQKKVFAEALGKEQWPLPPSFPSSFENRLCSGHKNSKSIPSHPAASLSLSSTRVFSSLARNTQDSAPVSAAPHHNLYSYFFGRFNLNKKNQQLFSGDATTSLLARQKFPKVQKKFASSSDRALPGSKADEVPFFITNFLEDRSRNLRWTLGSFVAAAVSILPAAAAHLLVDTALDAEISKDRDDYDWSEAAHKRLFYASAFSRYFTSDVQLKTALENCLSTAEDNQNWAFKHLHMVIMSGSTKPEQLIQKLPLTDILDSLENAQERETIENLAQVLEDLSFFPECNEKIGDTLPYLYTMSFTSGPRAKKHVAVILSNLAAQPAVVTQMAPMVGALRNLIEHAPNKSTRKYAQYALRQILDEGKRNPDFNQSLSNSLKLAEVDDTLVSSVNSASNPQSPFLSRLAFVATAASVAAVWTPARLLVRNIISQKKQDILAQTKVRLPSALVGAAVLGLLMEANKATTSSLISGSHPLRAQGLETTSLLFDYFSIFVISGLMPFSAAPILSSYLVNVLFFDDKLYLPK